MGRSPTVDREDSRDLVLPPALLHSEESRWDTGPHLDNSPDLHRELVSWLAKDVVTAGPEVAWEAVIGHAEVNSRIATLRRRPDAT